MIEDFLLRLFEPPARPKHGEEDGEAYVRGTSGYAGASSDDTKDLINHALRRYYIYRGVEHGASELSDRFFPSEESRLSRENMRLQNRKLRRELDLPLDDDEYERLLNTKRLSDAAQGMLVGATAKYEPFLPGGGSGKTSFSTIFDIFDDTGTRGSPFTPGNGVRHAANRSKWGRAAKLFFR